MKLGKLATFMARKRSTPHSFKETLTERAKKLKAEAAELPPGAERDAKMRLVRELDTTAHMDEWLTSPGLRAPR